MTSKEALKKENKELNDVIEKYNHLNIQSFFIRDREREEIKQLKKAIEILKKYYKFKLFPPAMDNIPEISISTDWEHYISQQEYELLKEVLGEWQLL